MMKTKAIKKILPLFLAVATTPLFAQPKFLSTQETKRVEQSPTQQKATSEPINPFLENGRVKLPTSAPEDDWSPEELRSMGLTPQSYKEIQAQARRNSATPSAPIVATQPAPSLRSPVGVPENPQRVPRLGSLNGAMPAGVSSGLGSVDPSRPGLKSGSKTEFEMMLGPAILTEHTTTNRQSIEYWEKNKKSPPRISDTEKASKIAAVGYLIPGLEQRGVSPQKINLELERKSAEQFTDWANRIIMIAQ